MGSPIDRTAKTALDSNLVNGVTSDAPKVKANNDVLYNYSDTLNSALDTHAAAAILPHADSSVTGPKIRDGAVTTAKIADLAVTQAKIANGAVGANQLATGLAVTADVNAQFAKRGIDVTSAPYNADPTGVNDSTAAINAAIAAIPSTGGILYFPPGTYVVSPTTTAAINLKSNLTIEGAGSASIIKIKNNNGNFQTLFGQSSGTIQNVTIRKIKIDQNAAGNTVSSIDVGVTAQLLIYLTDFDGVLIEDVRFEPCSGINTVSLNGSTAKNAIVRNCYFKFVRGNGAPNYDNSAVYMHCENHKVHGNTFEAAIAEVAFGAIETHNGLSNVYGNTIKGYQTMVNVVTESGTRGRNNSDINVYGNVGTDVQFGVRLWSIAGKILSNVNVSNNVISINQLTRLAVSCDGITLEYLAGATLTGTFDTINLIGNTIYFEDEGAGRTTTSEASTNGIALRPKGNIKNVQVVGNIIVNAPTRGIALGNGTEANTSQNVTIKNNIIINAGQNLLAVAGFRVAITTESVIKSCDITENHINDTNATFKGYQSLYANTGTYSNTTIKNNYASAIQGGYYYNVPVTAGIDQGDQFKVRYASSFPPSTGSFDAGDILYITGALTAGKSPIGYKCTVNGTYGTLAGVTGTCTAGSSTITVNDSSAIKIGDILFIAGSSAALRVNQITGNTLLMSSNYGVSVAAGATSFFAPTLIPFGVVGPTGKGTTANRPSGLGANDAGLKYYDTTLVATQGKPIEWNGANWIDSSGTIV